VAKNKQMSISMERLVLAAKGYPAKITTARGKYLFSFEHRHFICDTLAEAVRQALYHHEGIHRLFERGTLEEEMYERGFLTVGTVNGIRTPVRVA
jgi:hypothetical protein